MTTPSKFAGVLKAASGREDHPAAIDTGAGEEGPRKRGRPSGKRSSAAHVQTTAYIHRDTHAQVMLTLAEARYKSTGRISDFSELVDTLLSDWLKTQTSK